MKDGGSAFPYSALEPNPEARQLVGSIYADSRGMTLRDYFAAKALAALIDKDGSLLIRRNAEKAYEYADAMLAERAKP